MFLVQAENHDDSWALLSHGRWVFSQVCDDNRLLLPPLWLLMKSHEMMAKPISRYFGFNVRNASCIFIYVSGSDSFWCSTSGRRDRVGTTVETRCSLNGCRQEDGFSGKMFCCSFELITITEPPCWEHSSVCWLYTVQVPPADLLSITAASFLLSTGWKRCKGLLLAGHQRNHPRSHFNLFSPRLASFWRCV